MIARPKQDTANFAFVQPTKLRGLLFSRASESETDDGSLWAVLMFCTIGLLVSALLFRTEGLDMSLAFF